jgi:hypothetical protein
VAGYAEFKSSPKSLITSEQIGRGQVKLEHLDPALYSEIRNIALHSHTGTKSRKLELKDLTGFFGTAGFYAYSSDGTKKYHVTINSATGAFVLTEV